MRSTLVVVKSPSQQQLPPTTFGDPHGDSMAAAARLPAAARPRQVHPAALSTHGGDEERKTHPAGAAMDVESGARAESGMISQIKYPYAVVLNNKLEERGLQLRDLRKLQEKVVEFLVRSGLRVNVLCDDADHDTEGALVLLIEALTDEQVNAEVSRQRAETFFEAGSLDRYDAEHMTTAQKLNQLHMVVTRALARVRDNGHLFEKLRKNRAEVTKERQERGLPPPSDTEEFNDVEWNRDVIVSFGPLHDTVWNERYFKEFTSRASCTRLKLDDQLVHIREHFGERVAFYFYFVVHYTQWLAPLALFMTLFYFIIRFAHWPSYLRGLGIVGVAVPTVWATLMSIFWRRKSARLRYEWKLDQQPVPELPNPHNPYYKMVDNPITKEKERLYDPDNNRAKIKAFTPFFTCFNMIVLVAVFVPFIQWYVYGKLAPTCECCDWFMATGRNISAVYPELPADCSVFKEEALINIENGSFNDPTSCDYFLTCFTAISGTIGTDRWVYILFQGIIVGIVMDVVQFELFAWVMEKFTKLENWDKEAMYESQVITKQFYFVWLNMFFWFWWIAFIYVPFGESLQTVLRDTGFGWSVPGFGWRPGVINIDEAFVTPLIATQSLNLAIDTLIPYCCNKKAKSLHKQKMALRKTLDVDHAMKFLPKIMDNSRRSSSQANVVAKVSKHTPATLQKWLKKAWDGDMGVLRGFTDDTNKYDAMEVVLQLQRSPWHPRIDYLDIMMQFGYVCQFTTCWALAPIPAIINNVLEVRGDVLKMMVGHSRPVPVLEKSIGEWENVIDIAIYLSTFTSVGLIVLATGELEYWVTPGCIGSSRLFDESLMGPDLTCFPSWGYRLAAAVVIWFACTFISSELRANIPPVDPKLAEEVRSHSILVMRDRRQKLLPQLKDDFVANFQTLFSSYDVDSTGTLNHEECSELFTSINHLAHTLDHDVRELTPADHESLFEVLDQDNSNTISFGEAVLAISRCEADPFLRDAAGFKLERATKELANAIRRREEELEQSGSLVARTSSRQLIEEETRRIIAASTNLVGSTPRTRNGSAADVMAHVE